MLNIGQKIRDINFVLGCEDNFINYIKEEYNILLNKRKHYEIIDFYNDTYEIELKSRSNRYYWGQYGDWSIGYNKLKEGYKQILNGKKCFLVFNLFTDKNKTHRNYYVYELTKERFENEDTFFKKEGGNYYRNDKTDLLAQIKQDFLIPINECNYFI